MMTDMSQDNMVAPPVAFPAESTGRGAVMMISASLIVAVLNYLLNIVLSWTLSPEHYGQIGVVQTLIFILSWFLGAGLPWVVSKMIASSTSSGRHVPAAVWRTYKTAWLVNTLLTLVVVILLLLVYLRHWLPLGPSYDPLIAVAVVTVSALGISAVPDAALQGLFRFDRIAAVRIIEAIVNIVISIGLLLLGLGAAGAFGGFAAAAIVACILNIWFLRGQRALSTPGWGKLSAIRGAGPMLAAVFGGVMLTNLDLLAVKFLSLSGNSDALVGLYQVAGILARAPLFIATALVATFYPHMARDTIRDRDNTSNMTADRAMFRWLALGVLPLNVILAVGAPAVVGFFFPVRYASASPLLALLAIGSAFLVFANALAAAYQAVNRARIPAVFMTIAVVVQIVGLVALVPAYGPWGAAIASVIAGILVCALLLWQSPYYTLKLLAGWRYAAVLLILAMLMSPLAFFFVGIGRLFIALWIAGAGMAYIAACFALHLVDAQEISLPSQLTHIRAFVWVYRRLLSVAQMLNATGKGRVD